MNVGVSSAAFVIEGNVQMAQEVPPATAGSGIKVGVVLLVSANTTWRLRRSDSACARRNPVCSESVTVRTLLFLIQVFIAGTPSATRMAKTVMVTAISIMVNPDVRRERR